MKVLSTDDAAAMLQAETLEGWLRERARTLRPAGDPYTIPANPGVRIALAKLLTSLLLKDKAYVYLTGWNRRPYFEHLDLLYGYRRSAGESRPLAVAPVHLFERSSIDAMISILCLALFFELEVWIFDEKGASLARLEHGGALHLYASGDEAADIRDFATDPEKYLRPMLAFKMSA